MNQATVLFFDIDGTLIDSAGAGRAALGRAVRQLYGQPLSPRIEFQGRTDRGIAGQVFAEHNLVDDEENWSRLRTTYLEHLPVCLKAAPGRVLAGAREWLEQLAGGPQLALGILTGNLQAGAWEKLRHYDLDRFFSFGGFGDGHPCRNDVARSAVEAAEIWLGGPIVAERTWVIGDTPLDIRCARAVGVRAAAVCTGGFSAAELAAEGPDVLLPNLQAPEAFWS